MLPTNSHRDGATARTQYLCQRAQSPATLTPPKAYGTWSADEHDRFLQGMEKYPMGPWSAIAEIVGTRSVRQVHSHAQKYAAKVERHKRGQGKMKRHRDEFGGCRHTGHRVVAKIPGKFVNRVVPITSFVRSDQSDDTSSRSSQDERNEGEDAAARQRPWMAMLVDSPHKVRVTSASSPSSVHRFQDRQPHKHDPSFQPLLFDLHPTTTYVLPSFDESLDFLINQFLLSDDAFGALDKTPRQDDIAPSPSTVENAVCL